MIFVADMRWEILTPVSRAHNHNPPRIAVSRVAAQRSEGQSGKAAIQVERSNRHCHDP